MMFDLIRDHPAYRGAAGVVIIIALLVLAASLALMSSTRGWRFRWTVFVGGVMLFAAFETYRHATGYYVGLHWTWNQLWAVIVDEGLVRGIPLAGSIIALEAINRTRKATSTTVRCLVACAVAAICVPVGLLVDAGSMLLLDRAGL